MRGLILAGCALYLSGCAGSAPQEAKAQGAPATSAAAGAQEPAGSEHLNELTDNSVEFDLKEAKSVDGELREYVDGLSSPEGGVRVKSALSLGKMGSAAKPSVDALAKALSDSNEHVRRCASIALGQIGEASEKAISALAAALSDPVPSVRCQAALALWRLNASDARALRTLKENLAGGDWDARYAAAEAAVEMGEAAKETVPLLRKILQDGDAQRGNWRAIAAQALGAMGRAARDALPDLISILSDSEWNARFRAVEALGKIAVDEVDVVAALSSHVDSNRGLGVAAAEALSRMGPGAGKAVPALVRVLEKPAEEVRDVLGRSRDLDAPRRAAAAAALGSIGKGARSALPALEKATKDTDAAVRAAASVAIQKIRENTR